MIKSNLRVSIDIRRHRGGFTLIELIAMMIVIAVLAAVAVPSFNSMGNTRTVVASKILQHDITIAHQQAIATGCSTWIVFDIAADSWTLLGEDPNNPGRASATILPDPLTGRDMIRTMNTGDFTDVHIDTVDFDGDVEVGFDWQGKPLALGGASLTTSGQVTFTGGHIVNVAASTGHVTYQKP